jgi:hypothetical protein
MSEKFNMADFLHKNSWFFGSGTTEENVLVFGYPIFQILYNRYCSSWMFKMAAIFKMSSIRFFGLASLILFYSSSNNYNKSKNENISFSGSAIIKSWSFLKNIIFHINFFRYFEFSRKIFFHKSFIFTHSMNKKCVAYPQEDFLFIKLITSLE